MNLFMMCERPEPGAFCEISAPFSIRACREDELDVWAQLCAESEEDIDCAKEYIERVYKPVDADFARRILFACDENDRPVGTCTLWKAYGYAETVHWLRVLPEYEGRGIGRALLTACLRSAQGPIFLHTQERNARAVGLYASFGFALLRDEEIGWRKNDLRDALPILQSSLPEGKFSALRFADAPEGFLAAAKSKRDSEF